MLLFSQIDAGKLYQAAFKSPEHLLSYIQSSILHDDLARSILSYLSSYCSSNEETHSYALFSMDAGVLQSRIGFVHRNCSLAAGGISVGLRGGKGFSFSICDSLFDLDVLPLDDPDNTFRNALPWLLILQLPIVKMYNNAVYERLLTRLYWKLANDDALLSAAIDSHATHSVRFTKSDFKYFNDFRESDNPPIMHRLYPGLNDFCCRKYESHTCVRWDGNNKLIIPPPHDLSFLHSFKSLVRHHLYYVVPSARNFRSSKVEDLELKFRLNLDDASYQIFDNISPDDLKSLNTLLATHSPRTDPSTGKFTMDTSSLDFAYFNDTPENTDSHKRYGIISKVIDHSLLTQLRRNDCFNRHIRHSLSGIFGLDYPATKDLSTAFNEHLRGWENKARFYSFYVSLDADSSGNIDPITVSWCMPASQKFDPYLACMDRWLITFSVEKLLGTPIRDVICATPSALNLTVPSLPTLVNKVWNTGFLAKNQARISASMLTAPCSRRDEKPYFASYIANLALAISEYFHSVYRYKTINGDDPINVSDFSVPSSLTVPLLRMLCNVGLMAIPISLIKEGRLASFVPPAKDIILLHTPRLLRYLSQDGYLGIMESGITSVLHPDLKHQYNTTRYIFGWNQDSLPMYRNRLVKLHQQVFPLVFGGVDNLTPISTDVLSDIICPIGTFDSNNYLWITDMSHVDPENTLWKTIGPVFKGQQRFLVLQTQKLYRYLRNNCATNIGPNHTTFNSHKIVKTRDKSADTTETTQQRKQRLKRKHRYDIHEVSHFLPLGRELKVKLVRKGFEVFVSLPWEDLRDWYGLYPPTINAAYKSSKLSKTTLTQKLNTFANCKKTSWGIYHEYCERLMGKRAGLPSAVFTDWDQRYDGEQTRLNPSVVRLFKDIGFVFPLKTLMSGSSNWEFNGKPIDNIPGWETLVESWRNYSFPLNAKSNSSFAKKDVKSYLKEQHLLEYEANLKLPKRERKNMRIRFTEEEDAAILKYYRRDMSLEDEKILRDICYRHDAFGVTIRANKLAEKLIKEHGIADLKQLPVKRVGKKLRVMLKSISKA